MNDLPNQGVCRNCDKAMPMEEFSYRCSQGVTFRSAFCDRCRTLDAKHMAKADQEAIRYLRSVGAIK